MLCTKNIIELVVRSGIGLIPAVTRVQLLDGSIGITDLDSTVGTDVGKCVIDMGQLLERHVGWLVVPTINAPFDVVPDNFLIDTGTTVTVTVTVTVTITATVTAISIPAATGIATS